MQPFRPFSFFSFQELETPDYPVSCVPRENNIIDVSPLCGQEGINVRFSVFFRSLGKRRRWIGGRLDLFPENYLRGAFRPHHGYLRSGPGVVDVTADLF